MAYALEKSIPAPKDGGKMTKWAFIKSMEIGDSFFVPSTDYKSHSAIYHTIYSTMKRLGFTPRIQKQADGIRVWRGQ